LPEVFGVSVAFGREGLRSCRLAMWSSAEKNKQKKMRGFFPFGKLRVRMTNHKR